jgi:hypothetical protein
VWNPNSFLDAGKTPVESIVVGYTSFPTAEWCFSFIHQPTELLGREGGTTIKYSKTLMSASCVKAECRVVLIFEQRIPFFCT